MITVQSVTLIGNHRKVTLMRQSSICVIATFEGRCAYPIEADVDREEGEEDMVTWFGPARELARMLDGVYTRDAAQEVNEILEKLSSGVAEQCRR